METDEQNYSPLFNKLRNRIKERGILGAVGNLTGMSTDKGAARRAQRKEDKRGRKQNREDRRNLKADSKAGLQDANAQATSAQADAIGSMADTTTPNAGKSKLPLYLGLGGGLVVFIIVIIIFLKSKK